MQGNLTGKTKGKISEEGTVGAGVRGHQTGGQCANMMSTVLCA